MHSQSIAYCFCFCPPIAVDNPRLALKRVVRTIPPTNPHTVETVYSNPYRVFGIVGVSNTADDEDEEFKSGPRVCRNAANAEVALVVLMRPIHGPLDELAA